MQDRFNPTSASGQGGVGAQIDQAVCRVCGEPITKKRASNVLCNSKDCRAKNAALRVQKCKARRAARLARKRLLANRIPHLPVKTQVKLIWIAILAKYHAAAQAKRLHSQKPLPAERGAVDTLDAVRRLSECVGKAGKSAWTVERPASPQQRG
jgi:hypothetical protein